MREKPKVKRKNIQKGLNFVQNIFFFFQRSLWSNKQFSIIKFLISYVKMINFVVTPYSDPLYQ